MVPEARQMDVRTPGVWCGLDKMAFYLPLNPAGHTPFPQGELQSGHSLDPQPRAGGGFEERPL